MFLLSVLDVVLWLLSVSAFAGWFDWIVQLNYRRIFVFFYEQKSKNIQIQKQIQILMKAKYEYKKAKYLPPPAFRAEELPAPAIVRLLLLLFSENI